MMRFRMVIELLAALILTFAALLAISQMAKAADIEVRDAYARASLGGSKTTVVYMTLVNEGEEADHLRAAASDAASHAALHRHVFDGDVARMEEIACLTIPPRSAVEFGPGGLHVMLTGLSAPLRDGDELPLRLKFDRAGEIALTIPVKTLAAETAGHGSHAKLEPCH
ncbi:MAG TPA: copper chaperone PCu(A)C [Aestuariivirgaceae bacterium]|jgi:copper(I)-binding protein